MKLLIVHFSWGPLDQLLLSYVSHALNELQAEYRTCPYDRARELNEWWHPELTVFFKPHFDFTPEMAKDFKVHTVIWDFEAPYEIDTLVNNANFIGHCLTPDLNSFKTLQSRGLYQNRLHYSPYACDPLVHREIDWNYETKPAYPYRSDICFVGNAMPTRIKFFEQQATFLSDYKVTIVGIGYRGLAGYRHQNIIHDYISMDEAVRYFNGAKINLNLFRSKDDCHFAEDTFNLQPLSPNCRTFEVAACGKTQICDNTRNPELQNLFGDSIVTFDPDKPESFQEKFTELMQNKTRREELAKNAKAIALSKHTYQSRISEHLYHLLA